VNVGLREIFTTPLFVAKHPQPASLNAALLRRIRTLQRSSPGIDRSNVHGWHSEDSFFALRDPAVRSLRRFLLTFFERSYRALTPTTKFRPSSLRLIGWANVLPTGGYNTLHHHPASAFSGCYYVQTAPRKRARLSGELELCDPRAAVLASSLPGDPFESRVRLSPTAGTLILFPSWLLHMVHPNRERTDRVSIAFNLMFKR